MSAVFAVPIIRSFNRPILLPEECGWLFFQKQESSPLFKSAISNETSGSLPVQKLTVMLTWENNDDEKLPKVRQ